MYLSIESTYKNRLHIHIHVSSVYDGSTDYNQNAEKKCCFDSDAPAVKTTGIK